mmetsp:Transcript_9572/g.22547  ORF Transcript_9572/g.22547 Transcript_9572/m.22547 type:complete len:228 (+) Transcript_9572:1280-1963(+)
MGLHLPGRADQLGRHRIRSRPGGGVCRQPRHDQRPGGQGGRRRRHLRRREHRPLHRPRPQMHPQVQRRHPVGRHALHHHPVPERHRPILRPNPRGDRPPQRRHRLQRRPPHAVTAVGAGVSLLDRHGGVLHPDGAALGRRKRPGDARGRFDHPVQHEPGLRRRGYGDGRRSTRTGQRGHRVGRRTLPPHGMPVRLLRCLPRQRSDVAHLQRWGARPGRRAQDLHLLR